MELANRRLDTATFLASREQVLASWPTGHGITIEDGVACQRDVPPAKQFALAMRTADAERRVLLQPRAGVALVDEHIKLLRHLQQAADLLPTTVDAYTRQNRYAEAQKGIERSRQAGQSLLNGLPVVNHGVAECRKVIANVDKPVEIRHGTPDARLLAEISLAAGFTSFEGGGISYNIPYAKSVPIEQSIRDWQYVDRLVGEYGERGILINREPFGPLSGTLVPPFMSHAVAILEGLLALEQGVRSITLGYGQCGNLVQDTAAMHALRELAHEYFQSAGHEHYELTTVFHQWMGGFPEDEAKAFAVIAWGSTVAALAKVTKVIVKTPHEAMGIPTKEANLQGLKTTRQIIQMLADQEMPRTPQIQQEVDIIRQETKCVLDRVFELGRGDVAAGAVMAFEAGVLDVPFAPSKFNRGKLMPVRDNEGAVRVLEHGAVPLTPELLDFYAQKIDVRARAERRAPCFQMVVDDIYAISEGRLVGRPS